MTRLALFRALTIAAAVSSVVHADEPTAASVVRQSVTIRIYALGDADSPSPAAIALASSLLAQAGIDSHWRSCVATTANAACSEPAATTELIIRLVRTAGDPAGDEILPIGSSLVDTTRQTGVLATIYVNRVSVLAATTGTPASTILARAMVHEATHLLLGTNDHSASGIMRPMWSREMLRQEPDNRWVLSAAEAQRMRAALARRVVGITLSPGPAVVTH